ncbi:glycosyl transferase family protein [Sphingomonas psychrotolerans]|uniref:Glycosyl transferase family protein n=1 Tax=Sphingomonas psychrotolerans TaxID=1327635 RepID=A0ABU3N7J0_9SPHN|nr:glycosyl transferase family protein [Sphingomonas psychrotolerans]MDT8759290.1 glycosyl transferase family protein [Sphingomonas psychrotolerans]
MLITAIDSIVRETTLFAAIWFAVGGIDDLLVDLIYFGRRAVLNFLFPFRTQIDASSLFASAPAGRIVVFIAAWDEAPVIGRMLRTALARFDHDDYRIYVGTYPNDPATIAAVADVAEVDSRVRLVIGSLPGPTTKADCLNALWRALLRDEATEGFTALGVALHDAEDIVHPLELRIYAQWLRNFATVQLPVIPLRHPQSRFVSGHYLDEFAEAHAKVLVVRQAVGAGLPLAGVGCAIRRDILGAIAAARGGAPFDASSLTEDYELGLTIGMMGGAVALARVPERPGGAPVAVRAYFPHEFGAAVRQKARWLTGIALAGWDRTGWRATLNPGDHWMRMRDRRATLALPVLAIAYATLLLWGGSAVLHLLAGSLMPALSPGIRALLWANFALLVWRLMVRALFVQRAYGWREAFWSAPRVLVGNYIALFAARRAIGLYLRMLLGAPPRWDKTDHQFPDLPEQAAR